MRTVQDIMFDVTGQTVHFDAPEGRPSSVTSATVFRWNYADDGETESAIGTPSVESNPNTTVDAASGYGQGNPLVVNVAATTGFAVDRTYLITAADGFREWFDVAEIDSGNSVTAKHPLHNAYASADTVQSTRIQATIDSTWVADEANLDDCPGPNPSHRIRWVYVVSGVTYVADSYFTLVRYKGAHGVVPQDIESLHPGWMDALPTDHYRDQGRRLINEAYRGVKFDLHQIWTDDAMVANSELVDELTRYKAIELTEMAKALRGTSSPEPYAVAKAAYQSRLDQLTRITNKAPIRDKTGAAVERKAIGIARR